MTRPSFREAFRFWLKLGFISFGGPSGQIAIMHEELVEKKKWISEERFLHALNYCMLLPGPEAQQLAIYAGWILHGTWGGIVAGGLFVIPSFFILTALSWIYVVYGAVPVVAALFYGLKAAVLAIVAAAVIRISRKALKNDVMIFLAGAAFIGIYFLKIAFPLIIVSAAVLGFIGGKLWPDKFYVVKSRDGHSSSGDAVISPDDLSVGHSRPTVARFFTVLGISLFLWIGALAAIGIWRGTDDVFYQQAKFFSKASMVTFGGAYAVLPYIAQAGVETYGWLKPGQMMDGLGLAETTPGPLIMVVTFVGAVGGYTAGTELSPTTAGFLGALVATYFTFIPCFLWIFLGAPHIEQTRGNVRLTSALSAITAAVVGVILNLAVFFGAHVLFPGSTRVDPLACALALVAFVGLWKLNWNIIWVILAAAVTGWCISLI